MLEVPGTRREVAAVTTLIRAKTEKKWRTRWSNGTNGDHLRRLAPIVTPKYMLLHRGRHKPHSALLTQLRTGKIGFNLFLKERRVPGVALEIYPCGYGDMTVRHVLLVCPTWRDLQRRLREETNNTDIRKLLGTRKGTTSALRIIIDTGLLEQFRAVSAPELEEE